MSAPGPQQVQLSELGLSQLGQIKAQLDEELSHLTSSFSALKGAQNKFAECADSARTLSTGCQDREILVPLTTSLYVPGKVGDVEKVIVDIGTGYYVEKPISDAIKFYGEKVSFVNERLEELQKQIQTRQNNLRAVLETIQMKMAFEQQQRASKVQATA